MDIEGQDDQTLALRLPRDEGPDQREGVRPSSRPAPTTARGAELQPSSLTVPMPMAARGAELQLSSLSMSMPTAARGAGVQRHSLADPPADPVRARTLSECAPSAQ